MTAFAGAGQATGNNQAGAAGKRKARNTHADFWNATTQLQPIRDFAPRPPRLPVGGARRCPGAPAHPHSAHRADPAVRRPPRITEPVRQPGRVNPATGKEPPGRRPRRVLTDYVYVTGPGSGEGINHLFAHYDKATRKRGTTVFNRRNVYFSVHEVDTLAGLDKRSRIHPARPSYAKRGPVSR